MQVVECIKDPLLVSLPDMADNTVERLPRYRTRSAYRVHPHAAHPSPHPPPPMIRRLQNFRFEGQRRTFLLSKLGLFLEAIRRKQLRLFWGPVFAEYWREFPWRLAITRDPHPNMFIDTGSAMLTDEEVDKRTLVMMTTEGVGLFSFSIPLICSQLFSRKSKPGSITSAFVSLASRLEAVRVFPSPRQSHLTHS
jgi:hypothetical protein